MLTSGGGSRLSSLDNLGRLVSLFGLCFLQVGFFLFLNLLLSLLGLLFRLGLVLLVEKRAKNAGSFARLRSLFVGLLLLNRRNNFLSLGLGSGGNWSSSGGCSVKRLLGLF